MAANIIKNFLPSTVSANRIIGPTTPINNSGSKGFLGLFGSKTGATSSTTGVTTATSTKNLGLRFLAYLLAIFIAIMIILLFVHYMITPVFILHPGDPGYIPVPGFDDGKLYWEKGLTGIIPNKKLPIQSTSYNYSFILDIFVENPLQFSKEPRILFTRGGQFKETPTSETLLGLFDNYNVAIGLLPDTNDLIVSVLNKDNNMENIIISNVPVQEPFRVGVIIMEQAMEVYMNGHLAKTRKFASPPKAVTGDISGPLGINTTIFKVRNLKIWDRILKTTEIRYAKPSIATTKDFGASSMPGSSSCFSLDNIGNTIENKLTNMGNNINNRLEKLSV